MEDKRQATKEELEKFSADIYKQVEGFVESDPIPNLAFALVADGSELRTAVTPLSNLSQGPEMVPQAVEGLLKTEGVIACAVVVESWVSFLPGMPAEVVKRLFPGKIPRPGVRSEAVCVSLHTTDSQVMALHAIRRRAGKRVLVEGKIMTGGVTLGGRMARVMPTRH